MYSNNNTPPPVDVRVARRPSAFVWLRGWVVTALGVLLAAFLSGGSISFTSGGALLLAAALISLFNVFLRPVLVLFALPFVLLTLGLGMLLINALLFKLTASIVTGFVVTSWWAAIWGALIVSIVSFFVNGLLGRPAVTVRTYGPAGRGAAPTGDSQSAGRERIRGKDDDVIDV